MLKTRVIPCLLLKDNKLVKTIKFKNPTYIGDPINAVKIFNEKEVDELIFLDIDASYKKKKPNYSIIHEVVTECFMPVCYGGGVNNLSDMKKLFKLGIEKISINTRALDNPTFIKEAAQMFGSQSIVVSIDVRKNLWGKYDVYSYGGRKKTNYNPIDFSLLMEKMGAGELMINSIDRDGVMNGYDIKLLKSVTEVVTIPVIACGGAGKITDFLEAVDKGRVSAVSAGSLFIYFGREKGILINYPSQRDLSILDKHN